MPHWIVTLAAVLGACLLVVVCGFAFGRMVDLPEGFPMFCLDLKQELHRWGLKKEDMPPQTGTEHDALTDAQWIRQAWLAIQKARGRG